VTSKPLRVVIASGGAAWQSSKKKVAPQSGATDSTGLLRHPSASQPRLLAMTIQCFFLALCLFNILNCHCERRQPRGNPVRKKAAPLKKAAQPIHWIAS
jgi:hypothetical protein